MDSDFLEAQKFKDLEIILIKANKQGKIKSIDSGYVATLVKGDYRGTFFQPTKSKKSDQLVAKFPFFSGKGYYCYDSKCFEKLYKTDNL